MVEPASISDQEFTLFQRLIYTRRRREFDSATFSQYCRMLTSGEHPEDVQAIVGLLTSNKTCLYREPLRFAFLRNEIIGKRNNVSSPLRVWSPASASGEELRVVTARPTSHHQPTLIRLPMDKFPRRE